MSRVYELCALFALTVTFWGLCGGLGAAEPRMMSGTAYQDFRFITAALHGEGLRRRRDVSIEIDAREVAAGFFRPRCDGLLLVAPLPTTAQGWGHIAPSLDLSGFSVHYVYDGVFYVGVPRFKRLKNRLIAEFHDQSMKTLPRLVAVAEAGNCNLSSSAASMLINFSQGKSELYPGELSLGAL